MALLAAETLDFGDRQARNADFGQRFTHLVQFERLNHSCNLFHDFSLWAISMQKSVARQTASDEVYCNRQLTAVHSRLKNRRGLDLFWHRNGA